MMTPGAASHPEETPIGLPAIGKLLLAAIVWSMSALSVAGVAWVAYRQHLPWMQLVVAAAWALALWLIVRTYRRGAARAGIGIAILVVVVLRIAALALVMGKLPPSADPAAYMAMSQSLLSGHGLAMNLVPEFGPTQALFPPLYAVLLAPFSLLFGATPLAAWLLNNGVDLVAAAVLAHIVRRSTGRNGVALLAGLVWLMWPTRVIASVWPQKEGLLCLLIIIIIGLALGFKQASSQRRASAMLGFTAAALALTQPSLALLAPLILIIACWGRPIGQLANHMTIFGVAGAVGMSGWWIRNATVFGQFVPLTTTPGFNLYSITVARWPFPSAIMSADEVARSSYGLHRAIEWIVANPAVYAVARVKAAITGFSLESSVLLPLDGLSPRFMGSAPFDLVSQAAYAGLWVALAANRSTLAGAGNRNLLAVILIAAMAYLLLLTAPFEFGARHRLFITPIAILLLAMAVTARPRKST